jgi:hypothetical protein
MPPQDVFDQMGSSAPPLHRPVPYSKPFVFCPWFLGECGALFTLRLMNWFFPTTKYLPLPLRNRNRLCITNEFGFTATQFPSNDLSRGAVPISRIPDTLDTFANYRYRNHTKCQISSLDLHTPFEPLCSTRAEMLTAISGGGRIGKEAPFIPRGCDMRWFSTEEICQIFERFEKVIVVGDSMMRHVVGAMNVLLRKDLGYGAVTNWNFSPKER